MVKVGLIRSLDSIVICPLIAPSVAGTYVTVSKVDSIISSESSSKLT
jgi:hypothetical protein